jgi:hypothetical protein
MQYEVDLWESPVLVLFHCPELLSAFVVVPTSLLLSLNFVIFS